MDINSFILGMVKGKASVPVPETQEKTVWVTENGTTEVLPDVGKLLSKVTVEANVAGGGGAVPNTLSVSYKFPTIATNVSEPMFPFIYKNELWAFEIVFSGTAMSSIAVHKLISGSFVKQMEWEKNSLPMTIPTILSSGNNYVEYEGGVYTCALAYSPYPIWCFDGESIKKICDCPDDYGGSRLFVSNGNIYQYGSNGKKLYKFNKNTQSFDVIKSISNVGSAYMLSCVNGETYLYSYTNYPIYKFDGTTETFVQIHDKAVRTLSQSFEADGFSYYLDTKKGLSGSNSYYAEVLKTDFEHNTIESVGYFPQCMSSYLPIVFNGEILLFGKGSRYAAQLHGLTT